MYIISALAVLFCTAALVHGQDPRICTVPDTGDTYLPQIAAEKFSVGYEKKYKLSYGQSSYTYSHSGVHTFANADASEPVREAVKILNVKGNYKHVMDHTTQQVMEVNTADAWAKDACYTKAVADYARDEDSIGHLLGFTPALGPLGVFLVKVPALPIDDDHLHNNLAVDKYTSCYWDAKRNITVGFIWWFLRNRLIPVSAVYSYTIRDSDPRYISYDFYNYQEKTGDVMGIIPFELPHFFICPDWQQPVPKVNLNLTFAFDSEALIKDEDDPTKPDMLVNYSDQMDRVFNVSRRTTSTGKMDGSVSTIVSIFDGTSGIRYQIDKRLGTCKMGLAHDSDTDILWTHLINPSDFFQQKEKLYYAGQKVWRGILCETAVYEVYNSFYRVNVRYEIFVGKNTSYLNLPSDDLLVAQLATTSSEMRPRTTTYQEIFNYDVNTATIADYDVSRCFVLEKQRHFIMKFPANDWIVERYPDLLVDAFIRTLSAWSKLSPVRISMVEAESTDFLYVTFTVFHPPKVEGSMTQVKTSSAIDSLYTAVVSGQFKLTLNYQGSQKFETTAIGFDEITRRTPLNWFRGFTQYDMIGVGTGMMFGTFIITLLLFWFVVPRFYVSSEVKSYGSGISVN